MGVREPILTFVRSQNFQSILFWDRFSWNRFSPVQPEPQPVAAETEPEPETEAAAASDPQYTTIEIFLKVVFFVIFILILMHPITLAVVNLWRLEVQCPRYDALYPYGPLGQFEAGKRRGKRRGGARREYVFCTGFWCAGSILRWARVLRQVRMWGNLHSSNILHEPGRVHHAELRKYCAFMHVRAASYQKGKGMRAAVITCRNETRRGSERTYIDTDSTVSSVVRGGVNPAS